MKASIVIPVFNKLDYTKKCLDSLFQDNDRPTYEVFVIDNGSTDGTAKYLEEYAHKLRSTEDRLIPIINKDNLGVAPAWNQGADKSTSQYIAILNNDILLTNGWLKNLIWALDHHKLDLVSPFAATGQLNYDLTSRAESFTKKNKHKLWDDYDFCGFVMPDRTYKTIGKFDENFKVGGYEDTDYCYRLKKEGMRYGVSGSSFIHHFGSSTLGDFKKQGDKHVPHNLSYFIKKWNKDPSEGVNSVGSKIKRSWKKLKLNWDLM